MKRVTQTTVTHKPTGRRYTMNRTFKWDRWYYSFDVDSYYDPAHPSWKASKAEAFQHAVNA